MNYFEKLIVCVKWNFLWKRIAFHYKGSIENIGESLLSCLIYPFVLVWNVARLLFAPLFIMIDCFYSAFFVNERFIRAAKQQINRQKKTTEEPSE